MSTTNRPICELFVLIAALAQQDGISPLNKLGGLWRREIDEHWTLWVNGMPSPMSTENGVTVEPYCAFIEFNGWPAGSFDSFGGVMAAGEIANETALCGAIRKILGEMPVAGGAR